jgi:hypothetical protein
MQEIVPIIVMYGVAVLSAIGGFITEAVAPAVGIIGIVSLGGLATYVLIESARRKKNSTLYAKLADDKNLTIEVWMRKPIKDKWRGKLDEGKNTAKLANIVGVKFDKVMGTRVMTILTKGGKPLYVPIRLAQEDAVKDYLGLAVSRNSKLKFDEKEWAEEFAKYVNLPKEEDAEKFFAEAVDIEEPEAVETDEEELPLPENIYAEEEKVGPVLPEAPVAEREVVSFDYSRFRRKSTSESIGDALEKADQPVVEEEKEVFNLDSLMLDDLSKTSKVVINLDDFQK